MNKKKLKGQAIALEYITIAWNVAEGIVAVVSGLATGSLSLVAYGLESGLEVLSSSVALWEMGGRGKTRDRRSFRLLGIAFLVFAGYVFVSVFHSLFYPSQSEPTLLVITAMTVITVGMFTLGMLKKRVARKLRNPVLSAEANFTLFDASLSGSLVVSLLIMWFFGWAWLDKVFAMALAMNAVRQGLIQINHSRALGK